ncbi:MAG: radical SAM protein [Proteobacteria bacterium]|nr:radical SAM protein [Pseudomonadota bacterium]
MLSVIKRRNLRVIKPALRWARSRSAPWFVTWALTERCNYTCDHCGCWRVPGDELPPDVALQYAREMVEAGVVAVNLCGGEVLLRPDLGDVIRTLADAGIVVRVTTNGSMVPRRIAELRPLSCLKLSLDGPPDLHDAVRGEGAYEALVAAVDAARGADIPVMINTVLTAVVCDRLEEVFATLDTLEATGTFNPIELRHDEASDGVDAATPTPAAMQAAVGALIERAERDDPRVGNSLGTLRYLRTWPAIEAVDCRAGQRFCRVLSDGRVAACDRSYAPTPPPPPGLVPTGFHAGVAALRRAGSCEGCWRNNTIEVNRALSGSLGAVDSLVSWF